MAKVKKKPRTKIAKRKAPMKAARTKSAIGRQARKFGHNFERAVVNIFKETFAGEQWAEFIRRADQAHKAYLPDVTGVPGLWPELQAANHVTPLAKLQQAMRDTEPYRREDKEVIPLAITRAKGDSSIAAKVTMRLSDAAFLLSESSKRTLGSDEVTATISLTDFLALYEGARLWENKDWAPYAIDTAALSTDDPDRETCAVAHCASRVSGNSKLCDVHRAQLGGMQVAAAPEAPKGPRNGETLIASSPGTTADNKPKRAPKRI